MSRKFAIIIGLQAFLIIFLFWVLVFYGKDEYEAITQTSEKEIETPNRLSMEQERIVITLNAQAQAQSEIKTTPIKASPNHLDGNRNYGSVMAIDQLLELRTRYLAAIAEANVINATLSNSKSEYARLNTLNQDNKNVSDKAVAMARANLNVDEAKISAASNNAKNIANSMRQYWGDTLTKEAVSQHSSTLQNLIDYKEVLVQITLPFDAPEPKVGGTISISPVAGNATTYNARYVSRAPLSNNTLKGKTYFYAAKAPDLRAGMQVTTLDTQQKKNGNLQGVIVPNSAVVWYGGKPWVYQKFSADKFSRLPINTDIETDNGWFYVGKLKPNDLVVTSGAQLLLSEEFKYQITNENDD